jgi:hypothetical protein
VKNPLGPDDRASGNLCIKEEKIRPPAPFFVLKLIFRFFSRTEQSDKFAFEDLLAVCFGTTRAGILLFIGMEKRERERKRIASGCDLGDNWLDVENFSSTCR